MRRNLTAGLSVLFLAAAAPHAAAQSTWTLKASGSGGTCVQGSPVGSYGNSWGQCGSSVGSGGAAGTAVTASAWSTARGADTWVYAYTSSGTNYRRVYRPASGGGYTTETYNMSGQSVATSTSATVPASAVLQHQAAPSASGTWFANAYMSEQGSSGFGAASRSEGYPATADSPDHAVDSVVPGGIDMVLLAFDKAVILSQFGFGWTTGDSDVSILRWTGDSAPTTADSATTPLVGDKDNLSGTVGASAWKLVGHYANAGTTQRSTGASEASSWWLISTYSSSLFGAGTCNTFESGKTCTEGNDSFKLNFLKTANYTCPSGTLTPGGNCVNPPDPTAVPEPGSIALAGLALVGVIGTRRRALKAKAA